MQGKRKNLRDYLIGFTYQEKRKRELENFRQELCRLRGMEKDELKYEYIKVKTEYEHKKSVLNLFVITIALAVLMNVWSKFFSFMELALQYANVEGNNSAEVAKVSFFISVPVLIVITLLILFFLFELTRDLKKMKKELMIIEDVINEGK